MKRYTRSRRSAITLVVVAGVTLNHSSGWTQHPSNSIAERLVEAARERTTKRVVYDGSYRSIGYPGGDVPDSIGVCTDLIIRCYRAVGVDLQEAVHTDMIEHFALYPQHWGLSKPDANIDHRRVLNLQTFFDRQGASLPVSDEPADYKPGDLVTWRLSARARHIGIVADQRSDDGMRPLLIHNLHQGPNLEDVLFAFPITGHYRLTVLAETE